VAGSIGWSPGFKPGDHPLNSYFPNQGYVTFLTKVILFFLSKVIRLWRVQLDDLQALSLEITPWTLTFLIKVILLSYPRLSTSGEFALWTLIFLTKVILLYYPRLSYFPNQDYITFLSKVILLF